VTRRGVISFVDWSHKLVSLFLAPLILGMLYWAGGTFIEVRDAVRDLRKTVEIEVPHLQRADRQIDERVVRLEGWVFGRRER
jgi:hypothetical protein